jgi:hypothetical protein
MDFSHLVGFPAVIENPLGNRGFAGINMGNNADVADRFKGWVSHENLMPVRLASQTPHAM